VAVGVEYRREGLRDVVFGSFTPGTENTAKPISSARDVKSVFGEVEVPLVGPDNAMSMVKSLVLSVSARYDDYSDFGGTFDPKVGVTYKPVDWLNVRANWGQSFDAPSLADTHAPDTRAFNIPAFVLTKPGVPANGFTQQLAVIVGGNPGLQPQKANTWSIGADITPPPIPGLKASVTYYNIALTDQIAIPPISQQIYTAAYSAFAQVPGPPLATLTSFLAANGAPWVGTIAPQDLYGLPGGLYSFLDFRRHNLGDVDQSGIDFDVRYHMPTSFGAVTASIGGTYSLDWKIAAVSGAPFTSVLDTPGASRFSMVSSLGAEWGNLTGTLFWYHTEGFDISPPLASAGFPTPQTHVGGFDTFNLFVQWDVKGQNLLKDLSLTLNVDNLFDADPPFYNGSGFGTLSGYAPNTGTLGRVVTLGLRKRF
jgi:iron complex outermembrane receptor protein